MKKFLLPMAAAFAALSASAIVETPILTYDYSEATETGLTTDFYAKGANPTAPVWSTVGGDERYDNGLLILTGNIADQSTFETLTSGISIQKMGGEVGNVLCINGTSDFNTATGLEAPVLTFRPFWHLNWFLSPDNTPVGGSAEEPKIRVRMTFNVYNPDSEVNIPKCAYITNNQNSTSTNDTGTDTGVSTSNFLDEEGNWDNTKWAVYEFDTFCASGEDYTPVRFKFEFTGQAAGILGHTLLIQKVEFIAISDYTADEIHVGSRNITYKTMNVKFGEDKEVADDNETTGVSNIAVDANSSVEYFNLQGVRVANPENGIFIRRQAGKATKVIM